MNENDESVDPVREATPGVEYLRPEISENGEVVYRIYDVIKVPTIPSCFFREQERGREAEGSFLFFQRGSLRGSSASGFPFRINGIN